MSATLRPEAIDSRLVFHVYACIALPAGILVYMWPLLMMEPDPSWWFAAGRIAGAGVAAAGCCAASFAAIEDPLARARGLRGFAPPEAGTRVARRSSVGQS